MHHASVFSRLRTICAACLLFGATQRAGAQAVPGDLGHQLRGYVSAHDANIVRSLAEFVSIPNLATDSAGIRRNAAHLLDMLSARGITGRLLESTTGGPPAVYGELRTPGAKKTIVFYAHYDGQPVVPAQWVTPPWQPTLRDKPLDQGGSVIEIPSSAGGMNAEWRLYGRSASDDKAPIVAMLTALDALKAAGVAPSVNLKFFFDGEEEAGSPHLHDILVHNTALLAADAWIFGDGPTHASRRQQVVFGARGVTGMQMTVYGPSHALHSGHYGNWVPNPIALLANLIASMRNDDGKILISHFYDDVDPLTAPDRKAIAAFPRGDSALRAEVQLGATEANNALLVERIMMPALNLRGISGGAVGATTANAVPTEATASIDFRLVPHETPERIRALVEQHIRSQGFYIVDHTPTPAERMAHARVIKVSWESGYPAVRISTDAPLSRAVFRATQDAVGAPIVALPILGGSLPLYDFASVLHEPLIVLPIVNHDNNQHAANENVRLQNLFDGVAVYAGVLARLGSYWTSPASGSAER